VSHWWCCCGCRYFSDAFSRDEGDTELGDRWLIEAGTWTVLAGTLQTASANALAVAEKEEPGDNPAMVASVCVLLPAVGDQGRLICNYQDAANYWYVQVTIVDETHAELEIHQVVAGVHTEIGTPSSQSRSLDDWYTIRLCLVDDRLIVELQVSGCESEITTWIAAERVEDCTIVSTKAGLGTGSLDDAIQFDEFGLYRHYSVDERCPRCGHQCGALCYFTGTVPEEMVLDVGVGGLIDLNCGYCNQVQGEYTLSSIYGACLWRYEENNVCVWGLNSRNLLVELNLLGIAGAWYFLATVKLWILGGPGGDAAQFQSAVSESDDCLALLDENGKIPLTKIYETWGPACDPASAMPDTIYAWVAP